jgi:hypothetical protein
MGGLLKLSKAILKIVPDATAPKFKTLITKGLVLFNP